MSDVRIESVGEEAGKRQLSHRGSKEIRCGTKGVSEVANLADSMQDNVPIEIFKGNRVPSLAHEGKRFQGTDGRTPDRADVVVLQ